VRFTVVVMLLAILVMALFTMLAVPAFLTMVAIATAIKYAFRTNNTGLLHAQCVAISIVASCGFFYTGLVYPVFAEVPSLILQWNGAPSPVLLDIGLVYCTLFTSFTSMPLWLVALFPLATASTAAALDSSDTDHVIRVCTAVLTLATIMLFESRRNFQSRALIHHMQIKCQDAATLTVLTQNQESQRQLKVTEENTLGVLNHCAKV